MKAGETIQAEHISGKVAEILVTKSEMIAHGTMGDIYRIEGTLGSKKVKMIVKDYARSLDDTDDDRSPAELAAHAVQMHAIVKSLGIQTWRTLRVTNKEGVLLLSEGEKDDNTVLVTSTAESAKAEALFQTLDTLISSEETEDKENPLQAQWRRGSAKAVNVAIEYARKLSEKHILLPPDTWIFSFTQKEQGTAELNIFIGDFDSMRTITPEQVQYQGHDFTEYVEGENLAILQMELCNVLLMVMKPDSFHREARKILELFE